MKYDEQFIIQEYEAGRTTKDIAISLGTYNTTIRRILKRNNINLRTNSEIQGIVKTNPFLKSGANYWLGWLASDGCLTKGAIILELQERDSPILEEYIKFIEYPLNINTSYSKRFNKYLKRVAFRHADTYQYLISLGITPKKSSTLCVNLEIDFDFLRGVFEGDGNVIEINNRTGLSISIASNSNMFIQQLSIFLNNNSIEHSIYIRTDTVNTIVIRKKASIMTLYNKLYPKDCIFLKRKYDKFGYVIQKWNNKNLAKTGKESFLQSRASNQLSAVTL